MTRLKGTWVTNDLEYLYISDTSYQTNNYLGNSTLREQGFILYLLGDTISLQSHYTSSTTDFKVKYVEKYDLKIKELTDSTLTVIPVSDFSKRFLNKRIIIFKKQEFNVDNSISFEKIIFHTTECFGSCNVYHLQIDSSKNIQLQVEVAYKNRSYQRDTSKQGFYSGRLSDSLYKQFIHAIKTSSLRQLKMNNTECCDGVVITMIIHFNGQRKYFKTMTPAMISSNLVATLYKICSAGNLTKTRAAFILER